MKMVEVQDLVLFPERTVQNETMEALLDWICSMASPDDPVEWRAKFIEAYGAKVKYIASKQAVPSTINFDGEERMNPFLEVRLIYGMHAHCVYNVEKHTQKVKAVRVVHTGGACMGRHSKAGSHDFARGCGCVFWRGG